MLSNVFSDGAKILSRAMMVDALQGKPALKEKETQQNQWDFAVRWIVFSFKFALSFSTGYRGMVLCNAKS